MAAANSGSNFEPIDRSSTGVQGTPRETPQGQPRDGPKRIYSHRDFSGNYPWTSPDIRPDVFSLRSRSVAETHQLVFLVVDENTDSRQLLTQTLARKFPNSILHEARDGDAAIALVKRVAFSAIISHRTYDYDGETLVALFRRLNPAVPIVMVSGYDRAERARTAGANAFLNYDKWLMIGTVVSKVLATPANAARDKLLIVGDELAESPT